MSMMSSNVESQELHTSLCAQSVSQQTDNPDNRNWNTGDSVELPGMPPELRSRYSAVASATYDLNGLYLKVRFRDPTPMVNHVDPKQRPDEGFKADALLMGLQAEGGKTVQLLSYFYTDRASPITRIWHGGKEQNPRTTSTAPIGVKATFRKDGTRGYFQTLFVPWSLVGINAPPPRLRLTLDTFWGDQQATDIPLYHLFDLVDPQQPSGRFRWMESSTWGMLSLGCPAQMRTSQADTTDDPAQRLAALRYSTTGSVPIRYRLPQEGFVTLVVEKLEGGRIRNLMGAVPRTAGEHVDYWDGKNDEGRPVAAGRYRIRGLFHTGLDARYEFSFGSPGNPPWPTADTRGAWLANHTNPVAVLADKKRVYIAAQYSEGPHALIAVDYQGRKIWGSLANAHAGPMALSGGYLYVVSEEGLSPANTASDINNVVAVRLVRVDPLTGAPVAFADGARSRQLATWNPLSSGVTRPPEDIAAANGYTADWTGASVLGMAALGDTLYVPLRFSNRILKIDAASGQVRGSFNIERPAGVAVSQGQLLVVSQNRIVQINPETGHVKPLITTGLSAPVAITVGGDNRIYITDWKSQMGVRVFSPQGKPLSAIGRQGGRATAGGYDRAAMWFPRGISVDADNRLWVAEDDFSPRRVSVWDADGSLVLERLGGLHYAGFGAYVFPDNPKYAIVMGNEVELDWNKGRWRVIGTLWRPTKRGQLIGLRHDARLGQVRQTPHGRYLIHSPTWRGGATVISKLEHGRAIPVAAAGAVMDLLPDLMARGAGGMNPSPLLTKHLWTDPRLNAAAARLLPWLFEGPKAGGLQPLYEGGVTDGVAPNGNFAWSDLNADGVVDPNEIQFYASPGFRGTPSPAWRASFWARGVADSELNLYFTTSTSDGAEHWRLPIDHWTKAGIPVYQPRTASRLAQSPYQNPVTWAGHDGRILAIADKPRADLDGQTDPLVMFNPNGSVAWTYPSPYSGVHASQAAPKSGPGILVGPLGILGEATIDKLGHVFALHTNLGQAEFFTGDGLYIGSVFRDVRSAPTALTETPERGMSVGNISNGAEWFGGQLFQRADTGKVYVLMGREAANICQIIGLEKVRRLPESVVELPEFTQPQRLSISDHSSSRARAKPPDLQIRPFNSPLKPNQNPVDHWPSEFADWRYDEDHVASASWTWDKNNLYVLFRRVTDSTPMINRGEDPLRLFKPGDALLFELATRPGRNGDPLGSDKIRLVFSVYHGKPVAVLYRYGVISDKDIQRYESPTGAVMVQVRRLETATIRLDRNTDAYQLLVTVPLQEINFDPKPGLAYQGDFGVVYANSEGTDNSLRMYWANRRSGLVSDLAGEANIDPSQWGGFHTTNQTE